MNVLLCLCIIYILYLHVCILPYIYICLLCICFYVLLLQNVYYHSHRNPNLIAIVPVEESATFQQAQVTCPVEKTEQNVESHPQGWFIIFSIERINVYDCVFWKKILQLKRFRNIKISSF